MPHVGNVDVQKYLAQLLYDQNKMFHRVLVTDDATRRAADNHYDAWRHVMYEWKRLLFNKGYTSPSSVKQGNTKVRTGTCAKKLTKKGVPYKNWASRMRPFGRLYHVTIENLREGTHSHKV
jgi:hypothetical protein